MLHNSNRIDFLFCLRDFIRFHVISDFHCFFPTISSLACSFIPSFMYLNEFSSKKSRHQSFCLKNKTIFCHVTMFSMKIPENTINKPTKLRTIFIDFFSFASSRGLFILIWKKNQNKTIFIRILQFGTFAIWLNVKSLLFSSQFKCCLSVDPAHTAILISDSSFDLKFVYTADIWLMCIIYGNHVPTIDQMETC